MSLVYQGAAPGPGRAICAPFRPRSCESSSPKLRAPAEFALDSQVALGRNYHPSAAHEPGIRRNENRHHRKHHQSFLASIEFRRYRRSSRQDLNKLVQTPLEPRGDLWLQGHVTAGGTSTDRFTGKLAGRSLGFVHQGVAIQNIAVSSNADFTPDKINLTDLHLSVARWPFPWRSPDERAQATSA